MTFALYFGNRGFFPEKLIAVAREEVKTALKKQGHSFIELAPDTTRYGAVEGVKEGKIYAQFLKENESKFEGVILCLPNFGDENGAIEAFYDCKVPILIQAYPDEIGKMDFENRRDAYCGKFSIMDVFVQHGIKFTVFEPHVCHPDSIEFASQLKDFAAVCRVVNGMKRFRIGCIGARTTAFKTVRFDEITLQKYGITVDALDLSEVILRLKTVNDNDEKVLNKIKRFEEYSNFGCCNKNSFTLLSRVAVVIDDIISDYGFDSVALRCWEEFEKLIGVSPCVILSELNDRGIVAACETDVLNAVAMTGLRLASENAATCLDWNNNYGEDQDKCILFHCGPVPQSLMTAKGTVGEHKMFKKSFGDNCSFGVNEGRIAAFPMTYSSAVTFNGKLTVYAGEGDFTADPIEKGFFGCGGVAKIPSLQSKLLKMGRGGYRHHTSVTKGNVSKALHEAYSVYLGYDIMEL